MLTNDYFIEPNPYIKHGELDKYYLDQLEENYTKMTKTRDTSLGNSDKLNYKLLALLVAVFCIHFYVLSFLAQHFFTFFLTTFLLSDAMALRCQHYTYHLIHFLLAHFFTFASKIFFSKISELINSIFTKAYSVVKRKYQVLSSSNFGNLFHLLQKFKIRQLAIWKEKTEDTQTLISNYKNKNRKRRKVRKISKNNFFAHLQLGAYHKFRSSKNAYQKLIHDQLTITNYYCNNIKAANWTMANFQILTVSEVNYIEVSRTPVDGTQPPLDSSGPSQDQSTGDYTTPNTGANNKERNDSKNPFRRILENGLSKRIEFTNMNVGAIKNTITRQLKNKHVIDKMKNHGVHFQSTIKAQCSRKLRQGQKLLSKEKRKFKWKKRHKEYVVFRIVSQRRMGDDNELTFVAEVKNAVKDQPLKIDCECFKYDFAFEDVQEVEDKADWYIRRYERNVGKSKEKKLARKDILKMLKRQAMGAIGFFSPTASGYKDQVDSNLRPLELDWGDSPKAVLCGCPVTECVCDGNTRKRPVIIPNAGKIDVNIPKIMVIQLLHDLCGCWLNRCLYKIAPAPASTLMPRLSSAVSTRKVFYLQKRSENLPAENCAFKCKNFFFKTEKLGYDEVAIKSIHDRAHGQKLEEYGEEIYKDRTNEINERQSRTRASGTRLASRSRISSGRALGSKASGKVSGEGIAGGKVPSGRVSGQAIDVEKVPSGRVSGQGLDGQKVPSGRVAGQGLDGVKVPSGRVSRQGLVGEKVPSGRVSGQGLDGAKVPSGRVAGPGFEGDTPMIGDGFVEQEIEGAGETPLYSQDDNIYARGFILTTATQTQFDENGKLLREETDGVKIAFKLRYTTKKDYDGKQMDIELCDPCTPTQPPCELTIGSIKQQICNMKKGITGTLKTLSGTVSSYTRNWKLGVEEMSEHLSSYAKDLQAKVGFGRGEGKDDLTKGTVAYKPSVDGTEPTYDRDYFDKLKYPTKGRSWPELTPKMRYNESNQTDNLGTPAKSEYELVSKLKNYLKNLRKPKDDQDESGRGTDTSSGVIRPQKSHSDDCLMRTKKTHDFFEGECESCNIFSPYGIKNPAWTTKEIDAPSSKKMVKCKCRLPESSALEEKYDKEEMKPLLNCMCSHSKSSHEGENDKEIKKPLVKNSSDHSKSQKGDNDKEIIEPLVENPSDHSKSQDGEIYKEKIMSLDKCVCSHSKSSHERQNDKKVLKPILKCPVRYSKSQEGEDDKEIMKPLVKNVCHPSKSQEGKHDQEENKPLVKPICHHPESPPQRDNYKKPKKPVIKCLCHDLKSQERENNKGVTKPLVKCLCHQSKLQDGENEKEVIKPLVKCLCHQLESHEGESNKEIKKPLVKCLCHDSKSQKGKTDKKVVNPLVKCLCHSKSQEREDTEVMKPIGECTCHHPKSSLEENGKETMKPLLSTGKLSSKSINIVASAPTQQRFANKRFPST